MLNVTNGQWNEKIFNENVPNKKLTVFERGKLSPNMSQNPENETELAGFTPSRTPKGILGITPKVVKGESTKSLMKGITGSQYESRKMANTKEFNRTFESLNRSKKAHGAMDYKQNEDIDVANEQQSCRSPDDESSLHKLNQISKIDISQHTPQSLSKIKRQGTVYASN